MSKFTQIAIAAIGLAGFVCALPYIHRATLWAFQQPIIWAGDDYYRQLILIVGVFGVWGVLLFRLRRKGQSKVPDAN
jgi:uncharacterized membrane protein YuzA (DUF378 family)